MKRYLKEIIVLVLQLFMFYIFPLFTGPTDVMGMVILIMASALFLGFLIGISSKCKMMWAYCIIIPILFIPSLPIYYDWAALIYIFWLFCLALVGQIIGFSLRHVCCLIVRYSKR